MNSHYVKQLFNKQKGVGLIEVLVSLLVIAIGVLGMAGLQSRSLQHNQAAYLHSRATFLAGDMLDRIRANQSIAKTSELYQTALDEDIENCEEDEYPSRCETGECTVQQLAQYDIEQWKFQLACELPQTRAAISYEDDNDSRIYTIRVNFPAAMQGFPVSDVVLRGAL